MNDKGWVTDRDALFTLVELDGLLPGDQVRWGMDTVNENVRGRFGVVLKRNKSDDAAKYPWVVCCYRYGGGRGRHEILASGRHFVAWRRPHAKQHS